MNAQTPFDIQECAHGIYDDEYCHECALLTRGDDLSPHDKAVAIVTAACLAWCAVMAVGGLCWLTLSWLGVAL